MGKNGLPCSLLYFLFWLGLYQRVFTLRTLNSDLGSWRQISAPSMCSWEFQFYKEFNLADDNCYLYTRKPLKELFVENGFGKCYLYLLYFLSPQQHLQEKVVSGKPQLNFVTRLSPLNPLFHSALHIPTSFLSHGTLNNFTYIATVIHRLLFAFHGLYVNAWLIMHCQ